MRLRDLVRLLIFAVAIFVAFFMAGRSSAGVPKLLEPMRHMQRVMGMRVAKRPPAPGWFRQVFRGYQHPPHKNAWLCIHRYEGSWSDPNPPYYGGLQMDLGFQRRYGAELLRSKGTADHWSILEQMWTAERAFRGIPGRVRPRGFYPWPNTARYCGLL